VQRNITERAQLENSLSELTEAQLAMMSQVGAGKWVGEQGRCAGCASCARLSHAPHSQGYAWVCKAVTCMQWAGSRQSMCSGGSVRKCEGKGVAGVLGCACASVYVRVLRSSKAEGVASECLVWLAFPTHEFAAGVPPRACGRAAARFCILSAVSTRPIPTYF